MKRTIHALILVFIFISASGQRLVSGDYGSCLKLSYDSETNKISGYFENYTGWDEKSNTPQFSCIFYIEGTLTGHKFDIKTYYPNDKNGDLIKGTIELITNSEIVINLPEEHGGCWNVQNFADEPAEFKLRKSQKWIQVRYVDRAKAYFYSDRSDDKRLKSYLVKSDFICIEKIEHDWAYCIYFGKKINKGWLKLADLNTL